jgi:hypothetical protein
VCTPKGTPCVLPFIYGNVQYTGCTVASIGEATPKAWCATKVNNNGHAIAGHWTTCPYCNVSDMLQMDLCGYGTAYTAPANNNNNNNNNQNDMGGQNNNNNNNNNNMGGNNNNNNDMGGGNNNNNNGMGRNRRDDEEEDTVLHRARRMDCLGAAVASEFTTQQATVRKFDQASDPVARTLTFGEMLQANPGFMSLFVFTILLTVSIPPPPSHRVQLLAWVTCQ